MEIQIELNDMHERHRALTSARASAYREAAFVCLQRHHKSPIEVAIVDNADLVSAGLEWEAPDSRTIDAWANSRETTEDGACACVIAAAELVRGLFAIGRAETGTGADYYLGPADATMDDLEDAVRLEISGVDKGDDIQVQGRLIQKVNQARNGDSSLPALAGVMGFSAKTLMFMDVEEE